MNDTHVSPEDSPGTPAPKGSSAPSGGAEAEPSEPKTDWSAGTVELNLWGNDDLPRRSNIETPLPPRERVAEKIAGRIVWIFGWAVLGALALDFLLIGLILLFYKCDADQFEKVISKGIVPLLAATGSFATTLFGPLLAFVLGYYFSQKGEHTDDPKKQRN